jgi:PrtD family type I secretion system ABC transporter
VYRLPQITGTLKEFKSALIGIGVFSGAINILMLTGSFYMLQVYDRVLPSRSVPTLIGLSLLALMLYMFQGYLDVIRSRVVVRIGSAVDEALAPKVYHTIVQMPLRAGMRGDGLEPLRDTDTIRTFLSGMGPGAIADLPWLPLFLIAAFLLHPLIGLMTVFGGLILGGLTYFTDKRTQEPMKEAAKRVTARNVLATTSYRNAEALKALGMTSRLLNRWNVLCRNMTVANEASADAGTNIGGVSKITRMVLQSATLGLGAWLVINQQASGGVMIAASIIVARALAPIELAIGNWKSFVAARQSAGRLADLFEKIPDDPEPLTLPDAREKLEVQKVYVSAPGTRRLIVQDVSLTLKAGDGLAIVGPNGSGKSSLARAIVGVWATQAGSIRLDGATLDQWHPDHLGRLIGYLPQAIDLFDGTVAENIARFDPEAKPDPIVRAAQAAGVHDMVLGLPNGYDTRLGEGGIMLSMGQRQRIALARALYGDPFLVVLDEPNSNLDTDGENALTQAIINVRRRGAILIVIAHRPSALAGVDNVMFLVDGKVQQIAPRDEFLKRHATQAPITQAQQAVQQATAARTAANNAGVVPTRAAE